VPPIPQDPQNPQNPGFGPDAPGLTPPPQPLTPQTIGERWESLRTQDPKQALLETQKLFNELERRRKLQAQLLNIDEKINAQKERRNNLEMQFDQLMTKKEKQFAKELEQNKLLTSEQEKAYKLVQRTGLEQAKQNEEYQKAKEEFVERAEGMATPTATRREGGYGGALMGAGAGSMLAGGHHGALSGGAAGMLLSSEGRYGRLVRSIGPGGEKVRDVLTQEFPVTQRFGIARGLGLASEIGVYGAIAQYGYNRLQREIGDRLRGAEVQGQQVGGGIGAGAHMGIRARQLSINPFDAISNQMAQEIVQGVVQAGFKGKLADNMENAVKSIYVGTGMDIPDIIQLTTLGIRNMGLSLKETENEIKSFHENVRDTNFSLKEYAQRVTELATTAAAQGAGTHSIRVGQAFTNAFQKPWETGDVQQIMQSPAMQGLMGAQLGVIPQLMGSEAMVSSPRYTIAAGQTLDKYINIANRMARQEFISVHNREPNEHEMQNVTATVLSKLMPGNPLFGLGVGKIQDYLRRRAHGRGLVAQGRIQSIAEQESNAERAIRHQGRRQSVSKQEIDRARRDLRHRQGFATDEEVYREAFRRRGINLTEDDIKHHLQTEGNREYFIGDRQREIVNARKMALARAIQGKLLSRDERAELRKHITDTGDGFAAKLREFGAELPGPGRKQGSQVQVTTPRGDVVTIKLDPNTKNLFLQKDDRVTAANHGQGRMNDAPSWSKVQGAAR
jgi:hypothetical protein